MLLEIFKDFVWKHFKQLWIKKNYPALSTVHLDILAELPLLAQANLKESV